MFTIARFTFYEALHNRLFSMILTGLICILGLTEFIGELAITEAAQTQSILMGSGLRIFAVSAIGLFVITSMAREFDDKGFEILMSLPMSRYSYYLGKFMGFSMLALVIVIAAGLLLSLYSPFSFVFPWLLSLICELLIVISLSLLCMFTFTNITVAFMAVISFYFISRSMHTIQLISNSPILESDSFSQEFINYFIDAIAFVLPELNIFTQSSWLAYGVNISDIVPVLVQTIIYLLLLIAAGLFDLYRKNF